MAQEEFGLVFVRDDLVGRVIDELPLVEDVKGEARGWYERAPRGGMGWAVGDGSGFGVACGKGAEGIRPVVGLGGDWVELFVSGRWCPTWALVVEVDPGLSLCC